MIHLKKQNKKTGARIVSRMYTSECSTCLSAIICMPVNDDCLSHYRF